MVLGAETTSGPRRGNPGGTLESPTPMPPPPASRMLMVNGMVFPPFFKVKAVPPSLNVRLGNAVQSIFKFAVVVVAEDRGFAAGISGKSKLLVEVNRHVAWTGKS